MRAIVQREYGGADTLRVGEIERPVPGPDEVLIRVRAAAIDRGTWHLMTGRPYLVRLAGFGLRAPKTPVPGLDAAGTVEEVGSGVTGLSPGDDVFGIAKGSLAEFAVASEKKLTKKPEEMGFPSAGALSVSGLTALQGLLDVGRLESGQTVLVIGASGGVGSHAVQIAAAHGATVTGVASAAKADLVRDLGADHVIDYRSEDFADGARRYDLILDTGGNTPIRRLRRALAPRGTLVIVGGESAGPWLGGVDRQLRAMALAPFVGQRLTTFVSKERREDLDRLAALASAGRLTPALDSVRPLDEVTAAMRDLEAGRIRGKVAIAVTG